MKLLLTKPEVAEALGISRSSVDRYERAGLIPARVQLGSGARWVAAEVEQSLQKLTRGPSTAKTHAAYRGKEKP